MSAAFSMRSLFCANAEVDRQHASRTRWNLLSTGNFLWSERLHEPRPITEGRDYSGGEADAARTSRSEPVPRLPSMRARRLLDAGVARAAHPEPFEKKGSSPICGER